MVHTGPLPPCLQTIPLRQFTLPSPFFPFFIIGAHVTIFVRHGSSFASFLAHPHFFGSPFVISAAETSFSAEERGEKGGEEKGGRDLRSW